MVGKGVNGLIDITPAPRWGWDGVGEGGRGWVMVGKGLNGLIDITQHPGGDGTGRARACGRRTSLRRKEEAAKAKDQP